MLACGRLACLMLWTTWVGRAAPGSLLVEAEQFTQQGGWDLDQQFMEQMGSPYLLAHGLGVPVADATTTVTLPQVGKYRVWVRTIDWVGPWDAPGAPGKFQLLMNGAATPNTFGNSGKVWHWQDGGIIEATETKVSLGLRDMTGFAGRCDAILFSHELEAAPPADAKTLATWRRGMLGLSEEPRNDVRKFDLVVVGGGLAGTSAALSAARQGLTVALIQDRPVLGGNASSEVRVWPEGKTRQEPYPQVGSIVEEMLFSEEAVGGKGREKATFSDERKLAVVQGEPRVTLFMENRVYAVASGEGKVRSVSAQHIRSGVRIRITGTLFADCTGDATVGFLAGADYEMSEAGRMGATNLWSVMDASKKEEVLHCECKDKEALSHTLEKGVTEISFPRCPWAIDLTNKPFPGRPGYDKAKVKDPLSRLGRWFWESGFDRDPFKEAEQTRDNNFRAMYGAWDVLKNVEKLYPTHRLGWAAFIAGKRESRRLMGDVRLTGDDFRKDVAFPDGCYPCTWRIDLHTPDPAYAAGNKGTEFISIDTKGAGYEYKGPYWAPYRTLYSKNITNLFMAGRNVSVSPDGLGPVRVMRTTGMMGEIVGKAAWIAVRHGGTPRAVYEKHLPLLKELMSQPGAMRRDQLDGTLSLPKGAIIAPLHYAGVDPASFAGVVVDDVAAQLTGAWSPHEKLKGFVGQGYRCASAPGAKAVYPFKVAKDGTYTVRVAWQPHENRAKKAAIVVASTDGEKRVSIDQTKSPEGSRGFQTVGQFAFKAGQPAALTFLTDGAEGIVHIDAIQVVE